MYIFLRNLVLDETRKKRKRTEMKQQIRLKTLQFKMIPFLFLFFTFTKIVRINIKKKCRKNYMMCMI